MTVPSVAHSGSGTDSGTSIDITLPDTPADDELTIIEIVGNGTAVITPPSGWLRAPRCGGHSGAPTAAGLKMWVYYTLGDPGDDTPTFTSDTSRTWSWGVVIISGANMDLPFNAAREGGRAGSGNFFSNAPARLTTDCMTLAMTAINGNGSPTSGTWTQNVNQNNGGGVYCKIFSNVTNYLTVDSDGAFNSFVMGNTAGGGQVILLVISPATTDYSIPQMAASGLNSQTASVNTLPTSGLGPAGAGTTFFNDFFVPNALAIAFEVSNDESHTVSQVELARGDHDFTVLGGDFPYDNTLGSLQVSYYVLGLDESNTYDWSDYSASYQYAELTLSGSVLFIAGIIIIFGTEPLPNGISGYSLQEIASGTGPNPTGFTVAEDDLIVAILSMPGDVTVTNPAGYTAQQTGSGGGLNRTAISYKRATASGTEDPGAYTLSSAQVTTFLAIVVAASGLPPPENTVPPAVTGTPVPPNVLTTDDGTWSYEPDSYAYQWERSPDGVGSWSDIVGETANTYELTAEDEEQYVRCVVTATNATGSTEANSNEVLIEEYPYITSFSMIG